MKRRRSDYINTPCCGLYTDLGQAIKEFRATSPNDQIAALLSQRQALVSQKEILQRKMDAFQERVKEREAEKARKEANP
jgi:hypothetical protein